MSYNIKKMKEEIAAGKEIIRYQDYRKYDDLESCPSDFKESYLNSPSLFDMLEEANLFTIDEKMLERNGDKINWRTLFELPHFPEKFSQDFLDKFSHDIHWDELANYKYLSLDFILRNKKKFNWDINKDFKHKRLTEEQLRELEPLTKDITPFLNCSFENISEEVILEFKHKFFPGNYNHMSRRSISFVKRYKGYINWQDYTLNASLTEEHFEEFHNFIDWTNLTNSYYLSERIIKKYAHSIAISQHNQMEKILKYYESEQQKYGHIDEGRPEPQLDQPMANIA